jgi:hypothetical protein
MFRAFVAAVLVASALYGAKQEQVLDRAGLLGSCSAVAGSADGQPQWLACRSGRLTGYPDLSSGSCRRGELRGAVRYWLCPSQLVASRTAVAAPAP